MVGVKYGGVASFGGHHGQGGGQSPVDLLCGTVEVPPSGVRFHAARHPRHRYSVPAHGGCNARRVPPGPL